MASVVPPALRAKRPWFLTFALMTAFFFGLSGSVDGCNVMTSYNSDQVDSISMMIDVQDDADRQILKDSLARWNEAWEGARKRAFPLGVADFVLGVALVVLASRAMAGRPGARSLLAQVVAAQALLVAAEHLMLPDIRDANLVRAVTEMPVYYRMRGIDPTEPTNQAALSLVSHAMRAFAAAMLAARSLTSVLVVVALLHPRSRRFLEAEPDPVSEP